MTLQTALINCPALVARRNGPIAVYVVIAQKLLSSNPTTRVGIGEKAFLDMVVQLTFHK